MFKELHICMYPKIHIIKRLVCFYENTEYYQFFSKCLFKKNLYYSSFTTVGKFVLM